MLLFELASGLELDSRVPNLAPPDGLDRTYCVPRLRNCLSDDERNTRYTLPGEERDFIRANPRGAEQRLTLALMFKTFRHLGYFPDLSEIPEAIRDFVGRQLDLPPGTPTLDGPQRKPTLFRYCQQIHRPTAYRYTIAAKAGKPYETWRHML